MDERDLVVGLEPAHGEGLGLADQEGASIRSTGRAGLRPLDDEVGTGREDDVGVGVVHRDGALGPDHLVGVTAEGTLVGMALQVGRHQRRLVGAPAHRAPDLAGIGEGRRISRPGRRGQVGLQAPDTTPVRGLEPRVHQDSSTSGLEGRARLAREAEVAEQVDLVRAHRVRPEVTGRQRARVRGTARDREHPGNLGQAPALGPDRARRTAAPGQVRGAGEHRERPRHSAVEQRPRLRGGVVEQHGRGGVEQAHLADDHPADGRRLHATGLVAVAPGAQRLGAIALGGRTGDDAEHGLGSGARACVTPHQQVHLAGSVGADPVERPRRPLDHAASDERLADDEVAHEHRALGEVAGSAQPAHDLSVAHDAGLHRLGRGGGQPSRRRRPQG